MKAAVTKDTTSEAPDPAIQAPGSLSIGEMSRYTGLSVSDLRNWEARYGFPKPRRSKGGRRTYGFGDVEAVTTVMEYRNAGMSLSAAIRRTLETPAGKQLGPGNLSLFAALRKSRPDIAVHVLDKRTLLALTRAVEDCCFAAAQRPILIGAFQDTRFFRKAEARWADMASSSALAVAFSAAPPGADTSQARSSPVRYEIDLPDGSPMRREWALVCDGVELPTCVVAWERPGQERRADPSRVFEAFWSVDPAVVRIASRLALSIASSYDPHFDSTALDLPDRAVVGTQPDAKHLEALLGRTLQYLSNAA